jgi:hypothetical protein
MAHKIYDTLRQLTGQGGYETREVRGLLGITDDTTSRNMLRALTASEGPLPRKVWTTMIIHVKDRDYLVYQHTTPGNRGPVVTHTVFNSSRAGGQFQISNVCMTQHFVLGEISY